nr:uncharacterized protein LOC129382020 [Dermacentor andersoni]
MDASTFYGASSIQTHARTRRKTPNSSVDQLFDAIMNGDVSDADLSDDEVADVQAAQAVTASNEEHDPKMHPADDEGDLSDSDEIPAKKVKHVKWLSKPFDPVDTRCTYHPLGGSTPEEPLKYFMKYFTDEVFEDFTNTDGLAHDFELYQGKGKGVDREFSYLGLGGCVVMRLVESFPQHRNLKLFFDNYFTSVLLLRELKGIGILATGTIRCNRLLGCKLKGEKEMRKEERGSTDVKVTEEGDVALVRWKDNNLVTVASTQVSTGEARAMN